jgi:type IV secretion system protein VirB10
MRDHRPDQVSQPVPEPTGIVSVNSRGGAAHGSTGKLIFVLLVAGLMIVGAVMGINKSRASKHAEEAASQQAAADQNKRAASGKRRIFNTDPPPLPGATARPAPPGPSAAAACPDNTAGQPLLGPDGKPMTFPSGQAIRVCLNGHVIVPAVLPLPGEHAQPIPVIPNGTRPAPSPNVTQPASRYGGDVIVPTIGSSAAATAFDPNNPYIQALLRSSPPVTASAEAGFAANVMAGTIGRSNNAAGAQGSVDKLLTGSANRAVSATMIGNRNMILPEGRSIDCNLSVRIINEVSGKATCVLSSNVYSDNGKVVLAERGSTAVGEYVAIAAQGQRRLFILWTRLQTPNGVVVNVNSPAADALGTSGLPGHVDNRWPERIGAAVLLSLVEDGIGYATAKAASGNGDGAQGLAIFQITTQTGQTLAERILDSTINIKPTIYKNQGDRATIFVSRDLDFGSVYALRAK